MNNDRHIAFFPFLLVSLVFLTGCKSKTGADESTALIEQFVGAVGESDASTFETLVVDKKHVEGCELRSGPLVDVVDKIRSQIVDNFDTLQFSPTTIPVGTSEPASVESLCERAGDGDETVSIAEVVGVVDGKPFKGLESDPNPEGDSCAVESTQTVDMGVKTEDGHYAVLTSVRAMKIDGRWYLAPTAGANKLMDVVLVSDEVVEETDGGVSLSGAKPHTCGGG